VGWRVDDVAVWGEAAAVVEEDDAVAQQVPPLFGVVSYHDGGEAVWVLRGGTRWLVFAVEVHGWLATVGRLGVFDS
jgi:hypothetical protein